jgi:hypothetical protein
MFRWDLISHAIYRRTPFFHLPTRQTPPLLQTFGKSGRVNPSKGACQATEVIGLKADCKMRISDASALFIDEQRDLSDS